MGHGRSRRPLPADDTSDELAAIAADVSQVPTPFARMSAGESPVIHLGGPSGGRRSCLFYPSLWGGGRAPTPPVRRRSRPPPPRRRGAGGPGRVGGGARRRTRPPRAGRVGPGGGGGCRGAARRPA